METRQFSAEETLKIKELYGSWATCHALVVEYVADLGQGTRALRPNGP